jgi:hypothetical protein
MNPIAECAAQTLLHHPHPALRLSELLQLVAERVDRGLDPGRLRTLLEEHPETFRLLDPWVLMSTDPSPDGAPTAAGARLRESVRWIARGIDLTSPYDISRWYAIALAEREVREAVRKKAA